MNTIDPSLNFQPTLLGTTVTFANDGGGEEGDAGMISDETATEIYIESGFFTGWMSKADFWEALGIED